MSLVFTEKNLSGAVKHFSRYLNPNTVGNHMILDWNPGHSNPQLSFRARFFFFFFFVLWDYANYPIQIQVNSHF